MVSTPPPRPTSVYAFPAPAPLSHLYSRTYPRTRRSPRTLSPALRFPSVHYVLLYRPFPSPSAPRSRFPLLPPLVFPASSLTLPIPSAPIAYRTPGRHSASFILTTRIRPLFLPALRCPSPPPSVPSRLPVLHGYRTSHPASPSPVLRSPHISSSPPSLSSIHSLPTSHFAPCVHSPTLPLLHLRSPSSSSHSYHPSLSPHLTPPSPSYPLANHRTRPPLPSIRVPSRSPPLTCFPSSFELTLTPLPIAVEQNFNCDQGIPANLMNQPVGDGYVIVLTDITNATNIYAQSDPFSIKALSAGYPPASATPVDQASATVSKGSASNSIAGATGSAGAASPTKSSSASRVGAGAGVLAAVGAFAAALVL